MKKNKTPLSQPLSEQEIEWLKDFLEKLFQSNGECMTLEAVDGLFCALIVNPIMAKPSEWMKTVFGENHEFKSEEELEKVMMLLIRYWNQISVSIEKPIKENEDFMFLFLLKMTKHGIIN